MGKKQHSKDRMFITTTEWATEWGGAKSKELRTPFKRLPFYCCALTFTQFEDPVCTEDGSIFDVMNIIPYIRKFGRHPVTGTPLKQEDLIPLVFHKNSEGEYHCPVLNKVFTEFTHIVAVKTTGNVFCYEAIKELNVKTKNWKELLTDEPFKRQDIITLQNPNALDTKVLVDFDHIKKSLTIDDEELKKMEADPAYNINVTGDIKQMLKELGTEKGREIALQGGGGDRAQNERASALEAILAARARIKEQEEKKSKSKNGEVKSNPGFSIVDAASASVHGRSAESAKAAPSDKTAARIAMHMAGDRTPVNAKMVKSRYTSGAASRSFTSTSYDPVTVNEYEYIKVEKNPTKKGYVQIQTTHGDLNIGLHCDIAPRACENFITLCERGYYNNVVFHRNIKNFMIQGGDPTGTGKGGESIWGKSFKDEVNSKLLHTGRGVVSMANSGPHSNGSQFFILYKSAPHLNFKHTVFGGVVGGLTTLSTMEKVPVDDDDRPLEEIKIKSVNVFINPYTELEEEEEEKAKEEEEKKKAIDVDSDKVGSWFSNPGTGAEVGATGGGVGKYLRTRAAQPETTVTGDSSQPAAATKKRKVAQTSEFKDFSGW
jgi:peptidyl-prolyl cis-trans isomerase-like protein 2